jgi:hypothetical protein
MIGGIENGSGVFYLIAFGGLVPVYGYMKAFKVCLVSHGDGPYWSLRCQRVLVAFLIVALARLALKSATSRGTLKSPMAA